MILIHTHKITPRLKYTLDFTFRQVLNTSYKVTEDKEEYQNFKGAKINYSHQELDEGIFIKPVDLLIEDFIENKQVFVTQWDSLKIFFQTNDHSALPFDIFSAVFYMLSRYEEHLPFLADTHGRFEAKESLAYENNFLQDPVVDQWIYAFADIIKKRYPKTSFSKRKFKYISTIDIDNAYAFLFKGISRTLGATLSSIINLNLEDNIRRYRTLAGKKDPYDTYDIFFDLHQKYGIEPIWFFLVGHSGKFDNNVSLEKEAYQNLIQKIAKKHEVGLHPSYKTSRKTELLTKEKKNLESVIGREVKKSRQHYLKLHFNQTYQNLIQAGIKEDYTMGYATEIGFRAGTCTPFKYYDLERETTTDLMVYPFQIMDTTLNRQKGLSTNEAISLIENMIEKIKKVDGTFISIWHNEALSDHGLWKGWENVYREMLRFVFEK
ncbi:MAG: polysaccharide deacetylase family protein [Bacteroidota bacterium]